MALARSASGPGGLSINTSSANSLFGSGTTPATGGMFGSTQAKPSGGLFGSSTSAPQTAGLFGSATTSAPAAGGLFGSTTSTAQPATGGLFGSTTASTQPASGGLFGSTAATTQPATGGLFGSAAPTSQPAAGGLFGSAPASQSGGLFGSTATSQAQPSGSLFSGGLGSTQQAQTQSTGGLFGNSTANIGGSGTLFGSLNNQPKPATGLFGMQNQQNQQGQPQQASTGMFGQSQAQTGGFGGSTLGGQQNNQQQAIPGVPIKMDNVKGTTRFNDLVEDLQTRLTQVDKVLQQQIQLKNDCDAIMPSHDAQLNQIPHDYEFCRRKFIGVENGQDSDVQAIAAASRLIRTDAENAKLSFKAIDNLKLPPQYHTPVSWSNKSTSNDNPTNSDGQAEDIVGFFSKTADEMKATLDRYQASVTEIEQHLRGVEAASVQQVNALVAKRQGGSRGQPNAKDELYSVFQEFEQSVLGVAGRVAGTRESLQKAQLDGFGASNNTRPAVNGRRSGIY